MKLTIITYHYIRDPLRSRYPSLKGISDAQFRQQLDFLTGNYNIVRMEDVLAALSGTGDSAGLPDNAALLTFDDGYLEHFTAAYPLLAGYGIQGSFFPAGAALKDRKMLSANQIHYILACAGTDEIYSTLLHEIDYHRGTEFDIPDTQFLINKYSVKSKFAGPDERFIKQMLQTVLPWHLREIITDKLFTAYVSDDKEILFNETYCNAQQLAVMKGHGMYIGVHGERHDRFEFMEESEYRADISSSLDYMDSIGLVDKNSWVMCYPYGSYNEGVIDFIGKNGCEAALALEPRRPADINNCNKYALPRADTTDFPPVSMKYKELM